MRKISVGVSIVVLVMMGSCALAQTKGAGTRQPIAAPSGYFTSLNSAPKHTVQNRLSGAVSAAAQAQDPKVVTLPTFSSSFSYGGQNYSYTMVGAAPGSKKTTNIFATYVPMSFFFDEFVDQNGNNITIDATTITGEIKNSPLFDNSEYASGDTQFVDAQMRAEFWPLLGKDPGASNYHVYLSKPTTLIPVTIEVPVGSSEVYVDGNGTYFALIDINFIVSQLNTMVQLEPLDVQSLPIFLTRNAVYGDFSAGQPLDCCIGGFHTSFVANQTATKTFVQTLAFSTSLDPDVSSAVFGDPALFSDINALSHEIGETLNDPFGSNIVPAYQIPGAPAGTCQNYLEVGDVIENLQPDYTDVTLHGYTYHPQTLGLIQWFEGMTPSNAINGDYSFPDATKLTGPFTPCSGGPVG